MTGIDPNLKPVLTGDTQFGLDHELSRTMSIGFRYIHKWVTRHDRGHGHLRAGPRVGSDRSDARRGLPDLEPRRRLRGGHGAALPGPGQRKPKRNYDAFEVHLRKRFSQNWAADATYTYSRIYGNYPGLASSDEWGRNSPNVNRLWDNTVMSYDINQQLVYGLLNSDRPHQFKLSGSYDFNVRAVGRRVLHSAERPAELDGVPRERRRLPGVPVRPQRHGSPADLQQPRPGADADVQGSARTSGFCFR